MKVTYSIEGSAIKLGGYQGEVEIDDAELEGLSETDIDDAIEKVVQVEIENAVQWGWEKVDG